MFRERWDPEVVYNCDYWAELYFTSYEDHSYDAINDFVMHLAVPETIMSSSTYGCVINLQKAFAKQIFDRINRMIDQREQK